MRRGTLADVLVEDGRAAVMVDGRVLTLSPVGTALLTGTPEAGESVDLESLVEHLVDTMGTPPEGADPSRIARDQVQDLAAHKVLVIDGQSPINADSTLVDIASVEALHGAVGAALGDGSVRWSLPDGISAERFLSTATRHRVQTQMSKTLHHLDLPEALAAQMRAAAAEQRAACEPLAHDLHRTLEVLHADGIRVMLFKGLALAALAWGDYRDRGFGDLDMLIAPEDVERAYESLVSIGWRPKGGMPSPTSGAAWRYLKATDYELEFSLGRSSIDLHWFAHPIRSRFPHFEELWERRVMVTVGRGEVPTLSPYDSLAHSASHSAKDHWRWLRGIADVHRLASRPEVWESADRPLHPDQARTTGVAAVLFGLPPRAPAVMRDEMHKVGREWNAMMREQIEPERLLPSARQRTQLVVRSLKPLWLAKAAPWDWVLYGARRGMPSDELHKRLRSRAERTRR